MTFVILDAGHVQGCVIRTDFDSDVALAPTNRPEVFLGNPAANFGIVSRKVLRHFEFARRSLTRFWWVSQWSSC